MRCLIQRVANAKVEIDSETVGQIGRGLLIFVCVMSSDTELRSEQLVKKVVNLRIFPDERGKMNKSLIDIGGEALIISQFTLAADTSRGNRPGFSAAAPAEIGRLLFNQFCRLVKDSGIDIATGEFGANMQVSLTNDGPVTIWMEN